MKSTYNQKVYFNYTFDGGAGLDGRTSLNPGEISTGAGNWTFGVSNKNLQIEIDKVRFGAEDYAPCKGRTSSVYAECDKRSSTPNWPPDCGDSEQASTQANNNFQNSSSNGAGPANVQAKLDEIQVYLDKIPGNDSESQAIIRDATTIINNTNTSEQTKVNQLNPLLTRARNRANELTTTQKEEETAKEKEENRLKKAAEEKANRFNGHMQKGENALSNGKYDEAVSHYNNAFREAATEAEGQQAVDGINRAKKAKADEARKVRIEERQKQEAATNAATGAALGAVGTLMTLMNDSYTQKPFAARYYLGFGMENLILNINDVNQKQSDIKSSLPLVFMGGLHFTLFNNKNVNWVINPHFRYNQIFASTGEAGSGYGAGINTHLSVGFGKESPIRFFGEYQYNINILETSYDTDVASGGTTATDAIYEGYYETISKRIGGGIILRFINGDRETFVKPGYFIDNLSLLGIKRNFASLDMYFANTIGVELAYSKNYVSLGDVDFPNSAKMISAIKDPIATDYWTVKFYRRGLFGKK
ncbi:MAG: hypothetical protein LCH91_12690 [Bacteroidetes bacterium]|nr:hypothetical protein [Bacteroidota bacterium]